MIYEYSNVDRVTEIDYPAQSGEDLKGVKYYYDTEGRVSEVKAVIQGILSESEQTLREYTYDAKGRISRIDDHYDFKDALFTSDYEKREYVYDALGRVTLIKYADSKAPTTVLESYAYTYDKAGQILTEKIINNRPSAAADRTNQTRTFTYDKVGRLTNVKFTGTSPGSVPAPVAKSYTYDSVGNRLTETAGTAVTNYVYNEFNQLTSRTGANPGTLAYDANGNELMETASGKTTVNEYDVLNRLTKATVTASGQSTVTEATYNGNGQRIKKSVMKSGVVTDTANYFYQDGAVGYTKDAAGNKTTHNIYAPGGGVIASERYDGNHAGFYTYTKDAQGSTMNLLDSTGAFAKGYYYDDFGQTSSYGEVMLINEIAYTGGIYDESTGEYYLNARYYSPADGRFLTMDTYRGEQTDPSTLHLYAYCANNPVNFVDPSGHVKLTTFTSNMRIDTDGSRTTQKKDGDQCDYPTKTEKNNGTAGDKINTKKLTSIGKVDPRTICYVALHGGRRNKANLGDYCIIRNKQNSWWAFGIVADIGPSGKEGEASWKYAYMLSYHKLAWKKSSKGYWFINNAPDEDTDKFTYIFFKGSGTKNCYFNSYNDKVVHDDIYRAGKKYMNQFKDNKTIKKLEPKFCANW